MRGVGTEWEMGDGRWEFWVGVLLEDDTTVQVWSARRWEICNAAC
jgi:hypothetical protein